VILVGHSYGGAVITEAGTDANVKALVYIAAFMPDAGESVQTLIADLRPKPDRRFSPSLQREMSERAGATVVETPGSHSIYVSQPAVVADLIEWAASEVGSPAMA
jgi:hypothetical protein